MFTPASIGTPYTEGATRVLLLGSGELGKEVAIAFQRLCVEVHAADRYAHAPAHQVAHFWHELDMTDAEAVKDLVAEVRPDFIVPDELITGLTTHGRPISSTAAANSSRVEAKR